MAMTPENFIGLESGCMDLCYKCEKIISEFQPNDVLLEEKASQIYEEIIQMQTELTRAIQNVKTQINKKSMKIAYKRLVDIKIAYI